MRFGSDKPDLRNPLEIVDVSDVFARDDVECHAPEQFIDSVRGHVELAQGAQCLFIGIGAGFPEVKVLYRTQ